jgi:hypothetical protein
MRDLIRDFPGLINSPFAVTSPKTTQYNCIAWAAEDNQSWWWPDPNFQYYWPPNIPRVATLDAFVEAFESLQYTKCADGSYEKGRTKIAIFIDNTGSPTHAARQLPNGRWTSKCGSNKDIEHELYALEGKLYGTAAFYMRKPTN